MTSNVDISIVIGTYNRAELLRRTLESLAWLETDERFSYEILVVDNASTDDTASVIESALPGNAAALRGLVEPTPGVAAARNHGIRAARGEWIAFHDDDQLADPRWLLELYSLVQEKNCPVVGGNVQLILPPSTTRRLSGVCRRLLGEMVGMNDVCRFGRRLVPGTNNLMIRRAVFDRVGLFDETMLTGGEDAELYRRIRAAGYPCWYTPAAIVHHIIPEHRLHDEYMRWTAMRHGEHVALRELLDWGRTGLAAMCVARLGQALVLYLPKYLAARAVGDREATLGRRCLLWRSEAYLRSAAAHLFPRWTRQESFRDSMNFREGRRKLAGTG